MWSYFPWRVWREAPGNLNEPFIPGVQRPPGLMSLLFTHPAPALSLFPSVSHSRVTAHGGPLPALPSTLSRERLTQMTNDQTPGLGDPQSLLPLHTWGSSIFRGCSSRQPLAPED